MDKLALLALAAAATAFVEPCPDLWHCSGLNSTKTVRRQCLDSRGSVEAGKERERSLKYAPHRYT